jgi:hypothetical protein
LLYFRLHGEEGEALKPRLAALADYASVAHDGKLNVMGIIAEVNTLQVPFVLPQMYLVFSLEAEPEEYGKEYPIRIILRYENGEGGQILDLQGAIQVPQPESSGRVIANQLIGLGGVTLENAGTYTFSVSVGEEEVVTVPLDVNVV